MTHHDGKPALPRQAATLVLLRDGALGVEVLLLKRSGLSDVLGEAFVFPGGKLDRADVDLDADPLLDEPAQSLQSRLGEPEIDRAEAAGLFVAAIREACEECGVLLAWGAGERQLERMAEQLQTGVAFAAALWVAGIRLAVSELVPWSRWITPVTQLQAKRFDTRFFVARAPRDAVARHDGRETVATAWMRPGDPLGRYWKREIALAPPQIMTLVELSRFDAVAGILGAGRHRSPYVVAPEVIETTTGLMLCCPGDPSHSEPARVMPGPTRLAIRDKRYEPEAGFEAFFE